MEIEVGIAPEMRGQITYIDLINAIATLTIWLGYEGAKTKEGKLFFIKSKNYHLEAGVSKYGLYLKRNNYLAVKKLDDVSRETKMIFCLFTWNTDTLKVTALGDDFHHALNAGGDETIEIEKRSTVVKTIPTIPPNSIIEWARKKAIVPVKIYEVERDFYEVVTSSFQSIQKIADYLGSLDQFWNTEDKKRKPKKETEIHSIIHSLLYNIALAKNFDIHRESMIAGGNIEFILTGVLSSGKFINVCVEFKNAHSDKLKQGLIKQLPKYMEQKSSDYGLYIVLFFKGDDYDRPTETIHSLEFKLNKLALDNGLSNIRILIWDLSKRITPSKMQM